MIIKLFDNYNKELFEKITQLEYLQSRERKVAFSENEIRLTAQLLHRKFNRKFTRLNHKYYGSSDKLDEPFGSKINDSFYFECGYSNSPNEIDMFIYKTDDDWFIISFRVAKALKYDCSFIKCDQFDGFSQFIDTL